MGGGGGDNVSINVSTNLNGTNAQIDISPTGTGHVHIKPTGANSIEIAPTFAGDIDNMIIGAVTPKNGSFVDLSVTGTTTLSGKQIISVTDNSNAALRITQLGTGNALLVEDSTNPDSSPFVVTADGRFIHGHTSALSPRSVTFANQFIGSDFSGSAPLSLRYSNDASPTGYEFSKTRSTTPSGNAIVSSGDSVGTLIFSADDGTQYVQAASITAAVDGTPGTNDMPGRLVFSTTADGASTPTERMRIGSAGNLSQGTGGTSLNYSFLQSKTVTGATTVIGFGAQGVVQSDVTASHSAFRSNATTAAASFTLTNLNHFEAGQPALGAGSTVTNQFGFSAGSTLTGATNNYGFYSAIPAATGDWNFYAAGTATNFFGGNTIVEVTDNTNAALRITQLGTGNALLVEDSTNPDSTPFVIDASGIVVLGVTTAASATVSGTPQFAQAGVSAQQTRNAFSRWDNVASGFAMQFGKSRSTTVGTYGIVSSGDSAGQLQFFGDDGTTFVQLATIGANVDGTPGTSDMPGRLTFSTTADGASTPTERMRITSATSENILFGLSASQGTGRVQSIGDSATAAYLAYASSASQREAFKFVNSNGEIASFGMNGTSLTTTVGGSERMRIDSAGDVGIGTTNPVTKLEIAGSNNSTWSVTASISTTTMDVTAVSSGTIAVGDLVHGTNVQPYTRVTAFGTGSGGVGTYTVSVSQTLASGTVVGGATYGNTLIRITDTDTGVSGQQPIGGLQFYTSDASTPTAGVGAYVAALNETSTPDAALVFGTRDNAGVGIDANERMRITSTGGVSFGATGTAYGTSGQVLQSNGNATPTWTTNISGNSANVTGTVAVANGGTGLTSIPHTVTVYTSGSGTYTTPANVKAIWVRAVGGGGGGASNGASGQNSGSGGGTTTFGSLSASGGGGAFYTAAGGSGSGGDINSAGSSTGVPGNTSPSVTQGFGGFGGSSVLGGGGTGGTNGGNAGNAGGSYGGGGGGAGTNSTYIAMAGGGGGGYTEKMINSPSATYSYAVGAGGAGGTGGGTGGGVGGAGAAGVIIITEYYV
jgi:hypothetical protein